VNVGSDYWVKMIPSLDENISDIIDEMIHLNFSLKKYASNFLLFSDKWDRYIIRKDEIESFRRTPCIGIDSSSTPPVRLGMFLMSVISAVTITMKDFYSEPSKNIMVKVVKAPEKSDPRYAANELKLRMFEAEAEKIFEADGIIERDFNGRGTILLDGPLVDPPNFPKHMERLREYYIEEYVKRRAKAILKALALQAMPIGIVKKILGNILVMQSGLYEIEKNLNDYTFIVVLFHSYLRRIFLNSILNEDEDAFLATKAFELPQYGIDYTPYLNQGLKIFYFYLLPGLKDPKRRCLRVEIAFNRDPNQDELNNYVALVSKIIYAFMLPGYYLPIPILLAHKSCTIPRSTAKIIIKEVISRYFTNVLKKRIEPHVAINLSTYLIGG